MKITNLKLSAFAAALLLLSSCSSTKDISYFQDLQPGQETVITAAL